jgi:hypothetical protein
VKNSCSRPFKTALLMLLVGLSAASFMLVGSSQASGNTVVRVQPSTTVVSVGETFSVGVAVESVENLYGLDVTLRWNDSVLQFQSVDLRLGVESHPDGVLHEDSGAEIYVAENNASEAQYHLAATAVNPASSFNGSGTVFSVSFKALSAGRSSLELETELADHPSLGGTANLIEHTVVAGSVELDENDSGQPIGLDLLVLILVVVAVAVSVIGLVFFLRKRQG